ncbi:protein-S-isoprenylcysteine O-methyltransferase Ste14 [Lipingzhangella halophila]|uniref:Protein-S-isoprenylcysteine O-methyltransferase Ste14 n=1 Tax=Lipingzhangella halophila TaxID=1783352 RepID=A0A7W7RNK5_9ACTN|nr:hypothetical protein [Lipingzhangella halophila]MBB4934751.1 protein-S-isoprenylcysteine O-methyltransferase Ste14 [Lipingzhangella halophila]
MGRLGSAYGLGGAAAALAALIAAVQLQVRTIEEPYLLRTHGHAYRTYAVRTGRFLPGLGRLSDEAAGAAGDR